MGAKRWIGKALWMVALIGALLGTGCASSNEMVVDLYGSIVYEKPSILAISHTLDDSRRNGGAAVVRVSIEGDPGLVATFDIYPGMVARHPMTEGEAGRYIGEFRFPPDDVGGSFSITTESRGTDSPVWNAVPVARWQSRQWQ